MANELKLAAPWTVFFRKIETLFSNDSEIKTFFDETTATIKIYVSDNEKANSLINILPMEKTFGEYVVNIDVVSPNGNLDVRLGYDNKEQDISIAFRGNTAFDNMIVVSEGLAAPFIFVQFKPEVVQFYNDNLSSVYGLTSTLYEDIARDIFELPGVFFSTVKIEEDD